MSFINAYQHRKMAKALREKSRTNTVECSWLLEESYKIFSIHKDTNLKDKLTLAVSARLAP